MKESGFALEGKTVNGFVTKDGISINIDSPKAWQSTVGHEITHVLEGTGLYVELQSAIVEYAKAKGDYQGRYDTISELYRNVEGADIDAELTADLVGDYLFTDSDFVRNLSAEHRNVFQKIYDEVKYLLKLATAGSKEARQLETVKRAFDKAYREQGKAITDTKYSITEPFTDSNGSHFENAVLLDTKFFDDTTPRNWGTKLRDMVNDRSGGDPFIMPIVDENGNTTILQFANPKDRVTKDGKSNHTVNDKLSFTSDNISKLAVVHIDEIVSVSEENNPYYTNENNHRWLDKNGWLHRNANVINSKNGNIYNLTVDIAKTADGRTILYATNGKIKKVGNVQVDSLKIKDPGQNSNSDGILTQNASDVNRNFSLSAEGETPVRYGNFSTPASDLRVEAPIRDDIASMREDVGTNATIAGPIRDDLAADEGNIATDAETHNTVLDDSTPIAEEYKNQKAKPITDSEVKRGESVDARRGDGKKRSWYETSTESDAIDGKISPADIPDDLRYYQVKSNKETLEVANKRLASDGYAKSKEYFEGRMKGRKLEADDIVLSERLLQEEIKEGDTQAFEDLLINISIISMELGQRTRGLSIIQRLTPEGKIGVLRTVDRGKAGILRP